MEFGPPNLHHRSTPLIEGKKHKYTFSELQHCRYLHSFSIQNLRNPAKLSENSNLYKFKVIQGHPSCCQSKAHYATSY